MMKEYSLDSMRLSPEGEKPATARKEDGIPSWIGSMTRIAVYDSELMAPRVVDVQGLPTNEYIEQIASKTYLLAQEQGGRIPYNAIREVAENLIHAKFKEPVISIMDKGNTITFADQGPGIKDKEKAQRPGYTSASADMKEYIRGVGSGLPLVKGYLSITGGRLLIEDNVNDGTVITISLKQDQPMESKKSEDGSMLMPVRVEGALQLSARESQIMDLFIESSEVGQTEIKEILGIPLSSSSRALESLENQGLITIGRNKKRVLTTKGMNYLKSRHEG